MVKKVSIYYTPWVDYFRCSTQRRIIIYTCTLVVYKGYDYNTMREKRKQQTQSFGRKKERKKERKSSSWEIRIQENDNRKKESKKNFYAMPGMLQNVLLYIFSSVKL